MDFSRLLSCSVILSCSLIATNGSEAAKPDIKSPDLDTLTQNWDKSLASDNRFTILSDFNEQAVRDNETGLVWEKAPSGGPTDWAVARDKASSPPMLS
jgi:hypothetical protein